MADDPTSDTDDSGPDPEPEPPRRTAKSGSDKDWEAEAEKWKALARKHEKTVGELRPHADRAKELEDASRSDIERATNEAASNLSRAEKAEDEAMRLRVAIRLGLNEVQSRRLVGSSEEELEADAKELLASFRPAEKDDDKSNDEEPEPPESERSENSRRRPQERLRPGAVPDADTEPEELDPRKLAASVPRKAFGI
jgi:hypothetical protein